MSKATDNNSRDKEYNRINKYKDLEINTEKMWLLKSTTVLVIVGALVMIKKETDKYINKIHSSPSLYKMQKKNCILRSCSSSDESAVNVIGKYPPPHTHTKEATKIYIV